MTDEQKPTISISLARKINTGQYENADVSLRIDGLTSDMTEEDIAQLIGVGRLGWDQMRSALVEQIRVVKQEGR